MTSSSPQPNKGDELDWYVGRHLSHHMKQSLTQLERMATESTEEDELVLQWLNFKYVFQCVRAYAHTRVC